MAASMAASMTAMMLPTAIPFFVAYARGAARAQAVAVVMLVYAAVWAAIGVAAGLVMTQVMLPSSQLVAAAAIAFAGVYALTPWKRWGQERCQAMCCAPHDPSLRGALREGATYSGSCILCSAGLMVALVVLGMSNLLLMVAAAFVIFVYKLAGRWPRRVDFAATAALLLAGVWLVAG